MAKPKKRPEEITIADIEKAICLKADKWEGQCYGIALMVLQAGLVKGRAAYGHYLGPVASTGFWKERTHFPFQRHGWIELPGGRVFDATRWSFEDKPPYVFICDLVADEVTCRDCGRVEEDHYDQDLPCIEFRRKPVEYDEGGNLFKEATENPCPELKPDDKPADLKLTGAAKRHVEQLLGDPPTMTQNRMFWLANLSPRRLKFPKAIYNAIIKAGRPALIPIDNMRMVFAD